MSGPDATRPPRPGEEVDAARLRAYLEAHGVAVPGELVIEQFPGGHSNLTYLVRTGDRQLVLRRPPVGSKVKTAHDMGREHRVLSRLSAAWPRAPRPVLLCEDESVLGARFYLMERVTGVILRKEPPPGVTLDPPLARGLSEALIDTLVELHALDVGAIGLGDLGKPDGYVERQVRGWSERWAAARTSEVPAAERVAAWLAAHLPASGPPALIHNDFKYDNLVLDPDDLTRVRGVLDWEMSTVGDPLMDLGSALAYWIEPTDPPPAVAMRFGPTTAPGMMTRAELAARYCARSGRAADLVFYYVFGLFKNAVIVQQIFYRWSQGLTTDARFAALGPAAALLCDQAAATIERGAL
ncbi:MAG TPA: phosphotransferase family protein [Kofleriaceae bacterium]|nr:phosphotransferase family protein [Kofleriaceae bacterium]